MEDTFSLLLHGFKLAKDLESDLGNMANQPEILSKSCDDIIKIFATAKERLNAQALALFTHLLREPQNSSSKQQLQSDPSLQEWLKHGGIIVTQAMDMIQQQLLAGKTPFEINEMGGKNLFEGSAASTRLNGSLGGEIQAMDVSDYGKGSSSSSKRPRRSCHMSSTVPSIPPPPPALEISPQDHKMMMTQAAMVTQPTPTSSSSSVPLGRWLSMEFSLGSGSGSRGSGSGSGGAAGGSTTKGSRYGRDVNCPAVADMADVMFNSGCSSSSMDFIFPCVENKWGDKKN